MFKLHSEESVEELKGWIAYVNDTLRTVSNALYDHYPKYMAEPIDDLKTPRLLYDNLESKFLEVFGGMTHHIENPWMGTDGQQNLNITIDIPNYINRTVNNVSDVGGVCNEVAERIIGVNGQAHAYLQSSWGNNPEKEGVPAYGAILVNDTVFTLYIQTHRSSMVIKLGEVLDAYIRLRELGGILTKRLVHTTFLRTPIIITNDEENTLASTLDELAEFIMKPVGNYNDLSGS